jgi:hypothetical protein
MFEDSFDLLRADVVRIPVGQLRNQCQILL